jgi:hypothetical protein
MVKQFSSAAVTAALLISGSSVRAEDAADLRRPVTLREMVRAAAQEGPVLKRSVTREAPETSARGASRVQQAQRGKKEQVARGVLGAVAGAVGGFFAGGFVGSKLEPSCRCDDPGLRGFLIGAPIGAVAGAVVGAQAATQ